MNKETIKNLILNEHQKFLREATTGKGRYGEDITISDMYSDELMRFLDDEYDEEEMTDWMILNNRATDMNLLWNLAMKTPNVDTLVSIIRSNKMSDDMLEELRVELSKEDYTTQDAQRLSEEFTERLGEEFQVGDAVSYYDHRRQRTIRGTIDDIRGDRAFIQEPNREMLSNRPFSDLRKVREISASGRIEREDLERLPTEEFQVGDEVEYTTQVGTRQEKERGVISDTYNTYNDNAIYTISLSRGRSAEVRRNEITLVNKKPPIPTQVLQTGDRVSVKSMMGDKEGHIIAKHGDKYSIQIGPDHILKGVTLDRIKVLQAKANMPKSAKSDEEVRMSMMDFDDEPETEKNKDDDGTRFGRLELDEGIIKNWKENLRKAKDPNTSPDELIELSKNIRPAVKMAVAANSNTPSSTLKDLAKSKLGKVQALAILNPNIEVRDIHIVLEELGVSTSTRLIRLLRRKYGRRWETIERIGKFEVGDNVSFLWTGRVDPRIYGVIGRVEGERGYGTDSYWIGIPRSQQERDTTPTGTWVDGSELRLETGTSSEMAQGRVRQGSIIEFDVSGDTYIGRVIGIGSDGMIVVDVANHEENMRISRESVVSISNPSSTTLRPGIEDDFERELENVVDRYRASLASKELAPKQGDRVEFKDSFGIATIGKIQTIHDNDTYTVGVKGGTKQVAKSKITKILDKKKEKTDQRDDTQSRFDMLDFDGGNTTSTRDKETKERRFNMLDLDEARKFINDLVKEELENVQSTTPKVGDEVTVSFQRREDEHGIIIAQNREQTRFNVKIGKAQVIKGLPAERLIITKVGPSPEDKDGKRRFNMMDLDDKGVEVVNNRGRDDDHSRFNRLELDEAKEMIKKLVIREGKERK
jgi:hypothetical protein